jgi:hypothetical protein
MLGMTGIRTTFISIVANVHTLASVLPKLSFRATIDNVSESSMKVSG